MSDYIESFVSSLLLGFINIVNALVSVIVTIITSIISPLIPSQINDILTHIGSYFDLVGDYLSFALSYLGFTHTMIELGFLLIISIVMVPFSIHNVKLLIKWYNALKP